MADTLPSAPSGAAVRLVDVTPTDVPLLEELRRGEAGGFNDLGQERKAIEPDAWVDGRLRNDRRGTFFVERTSDGAIVGTIGYHRVTYGPDQDSRAWNIGIELVPEGRGLGLGTEAQRILAAWLFDTTSVNRVEASTDVENAAEARSLEKAGFTREGITRGAQYRAGAHHDLVVFSKLRSDPR
jgi:RimJ/RimL family protein N-acetyltransferase